MLITIKLLVAGADGLVFFTRSYCLIKLTNKTACEALVKFFVASGAGLVFREQSIPQKAHYRNRQTIFA
jgi:hypothetical protein